MEKNDRSPELSSGDELTHSLTQEREEQGVDHKPPGDLLGRPDDQARDVPRRSGQGQRKATGKPERPASPPPAEASSEDEVLTVHEVAAMTKFTPKGIYGMAEAKRIPHVKISNRLRFFRSDVLAWLKENRVPSRGERK